MSNQGPVDTLIKELDKTNPGIYEALRLLAQDLYRLDRQLNPPVSRITAASQGSFSSVLGDIQNFACISSKITLRLSWDILSNAFSYEIRLGSIDWDSAVPLLITNSNVANLDPVGENFVYGSYTFRIRAKDINGLQSINEATCVLVVPQIGAPNVSVSPVASTALLSWTAPTSMWQIDEYIIKRDGAEIARVKGTAFPQTEVTGGSFTYTVTAVDIVGNVGTESAGVTVNLSDPLGYLSLNTLNAGYAGTYVLAANANHSGFNGVLGAIPLETWQQHFDNNSWADIQDQIDAGYPLYFQPTTLSVGSYREVFDFGSIRNDVRVVALQSKIQLSGTTTLTTEIEVSDDDISYSSPVAGPAATFTSVRYARITWKFANTALTDAAFIYNLQCTMDLLLQFDSGVVTANAGDSGGTTVTFNKTFKFIDSITLTTKTQQPVTVIYTNVTLTNFKVLVFDSAGNRISLDVSWQARGAV